MTPAAQRLQEIREAFGEVEVDGIDSKGIWIWLDLEPENAWDEPEPMLVVIPHNPTATREELGMKRQG